MTTAAPLFLRSRCTLGVRDVTASTAFYRRALGWEIITTMGDPPSFAIVGDLSGVGLGLVQTAAPAVADFACCYLDVADVAALHRRCADAGVPIVHPLTRHPWGNHDFVIRDPDGHQLALGQVASTDR
ncbi:MAG TPA: VOC family protein [Polyangia bacterium]|jgi:catechol 2,3-dioxygenase-like lactoylglutathione lyase family enzyme